MRLLLALPALLLAVVALAAVRLRRRGGGTAAASGGGGETVTLTVGVPRSFGYLSTLWARDVQPEGVKIEYKYFPVFTDMLTALNSGKIDLTEIGSVGAVQSFANGGNVRVVAVTEPNAENCGLLVPKDSPVQTFADLKGKKIAFLKSTNSYISFLHQVKAAGLEERRLPDRRDHRAAGQQGVPDRASSTATTRSTRTWPTSSSRPAAASSRAARRPTSRTSTRTSRRPTALEDKRDGDRQGDPGGGGQHRVDPGQPGRAGVPAGAQARLQRERRSRRPTPAGRRSSSRSTTRSTPASRRSSTS